MINGFLGSGKTTILLNMIEECKRKGVKAGIILNELGEKNIEEEYFEGQYLKQLLNGCICCTIQDDLIDTLRSFIGESIDLLFIEGTGVANPLDIESALISPEFIEVFNLFSMISIVDASSFLEYQNVFSSSKEIRKLLREQISCASMVIVNKVDLTKQESLEKVDKKINSILNGSVPIFHTSFGNLATQYLFEKRYITSNLNSTQVHPELHHNHSTIRSIQIKNIPTVDRLLLNKWVKELPKEVLRGKGIIRLNGTSGLFHIQFSSGKLRLEKAKRSKMLPTIILIGDGLSEEKLNQSFHELISGRKMSR